MSGITLSGLTIYPVKSAAGIDVQSAQLTSRGLEYDRRWMVVGPAGEFFSQRRYPRMALISPTMNFDQDVMTLNASGMSPLSMPLHLEDGPVRKVEVWGDLMDAIEADDIEGSGEAKQWVSDFLDTPCSLVYMPDQSHRATDHGKLGEEHIVSFADAYPYLLISEASLVDLNQRLEKPVSMRRFRPNFVVRGNTEPFAEDSWTRIKVGETTFEVSKPCARCSIPSVDPDTGKRLLEPGKTLATFRRWDGSVWFGQNLVQAKGVAEGYGTVSVGDRVTVLS